MIARLYRLNALAHFDNNASTLVTQYGGKGPLWIIA
jgi:hypothetical protein